MKDFLKHFLKSKSGKIVNEKGKVVGEHDGVYFYTIGQRHGFNVTEKNIDTKPFYVIDKDVKKNILVVSDEAEIKKNRIGVKECFLTDVNWVGGRKAHESAALFGRANLSGRIRYRGKPQKLTLIHSGRTTRVLFEKPQEGLASGQSLVLYKGEECIGGGIFRV